MYFITFSVQTPGKRSHHHNLVEMYDMKETAYRKVTPAQDTTPENHIPASDQDSTKPWYTMVPVIAGMNLGLMWNPHSGLIIAVDPLDIL